MITSLIDTLTGEFLDTGVADGGRYIRLPVPRNPDLSTEKYSGNPADPIAAKSGAEIAAYVSARVDTEAAQQFDGIKMLKAKALSDLAWRLGKAPGALTNAEITAERTRILAIYKAL